MYNFLKLASMVLAISHRGGAITPGRLGLCLGNILPGGAQKSTADFLADLNAITNNTAGAVKLVRTYGSGGSPPTAIAILQAAQQAGFQVLLGTW
jgi:exo-beta-1,3-glucanase (GH17 family)